MFIDSLRAAAIDCHFELKYRGCLYNKCKVSFLDKLSMNFSLLLSIETTYCYHYYCILIIVFIDRLRAAVDCYIRLQYVGFFFSRQSLVSGYIQYVLISVSVNRKFQCNHCIPIIVFIDSPTTAIDCHIRLHTKEVLCSAKNRFLLSN